MAYTVPTAADLKVRYPAFAAVSDDTIAIHLADASTQAVDTSWSEGSYTPAIAAFAAHKMALLGIGEHGEAAGYARAGVTRIRSGNFDASFSERRVGQASSGKLDATPYGQEYQTLLRREKGGPRIVAPAASVPYPWCPTGHTNDGTPLP
jgi:hypothetical protein